MLLQMPLRLMRSRKERRERSGRRKEGAVFVTAAYWFEGGWLAARRSTGSSHVAVQVAEALVVRAARGRGWIGPCLERFAVGRDGATDQTHSHQTQRGRCLGGRRPGRRAGDRPDD